MHLRARVMAACAILAAFAAGPSLAAPASLTSFGTTLSAGDLSALAIHAPGAAQQAQLQSSSFAASQTLNESLAFDSGYNIETGARFASFDAVLNPLRDTGSFLASFDKRTGKQLWRVDRSEFSRNSASPIVWTVDGKKQIVVAGTLRVCGYDWESGHLGMLGDRPRRTLNQRVEGSSPSRLTPGAFSQS